MSALQGLVEYETAGDPMTAQRWVRSRLRQLSRRLGALGQRARPPTVGRLLVALGYGLHANSKRREGRAGHRDRDEQFGYIAAHRQAFRAAGLPVVSVATKRQEVVGDFKHGGRAWGRRAEPGTLHDFPQDAPGRTVP